MVQPPETLSGVRVVIVSGDRNCLQTAGLSLEVRGATVKCATTVEQALAEAGTLHPHIVVCDLSRPTGQFNLLPELEPQLRGDSATVALTSFASRVVPGFDFALDRDRDLARLADLVGSVMKERGLAAAGGEDTPDQPVPPEQEKPPVDEPPGEPGSTPADPRPQGDPPRNEPTRLVKRRR